MRILHAPNNIANQAGYVASSLRSMGHEAEVWEFGSSPYGFPSDRVIDIRDHDPTVLWDAFDEAVRRFDIFHFHFGRSFFSYPWAPVPPYWDLPVLRMLGKKVFFTFHGSDCRIRRIHEEINPWSYYRFSDIPSDDERTENSLEVIRSFANEMFIVSMEYKPFVPEAAFVPRVIDLAEWPEQPVRTAERPVVLHVPSRRGTKGSDLVISGMEQLRAEGLPFDFVLLEGVPHAEVRRAIAEADVVIDNVLTGDYEMVSLEAMASGRVAVAYLQERVKLAFPDAPIFEVNPDTFADNMRRLLSDPKLRDSLARRGRPFVGKHHDAPVVTERLVRSYAAPSKRIVRGFPKWSRYGSVEKVASLEERVAALEVERARALERVELSRRQAENLKAQIHAAERWTMRNMVPPPVKKMVRDSRRKKRAGRQNDGEERA
ncbi:MAG: glycosyltransferase family 4 protein [Thermoanaerobaculia bacterium]